MSRDPNLHIPEIEVLEERKEKLREEWRETNHGKTLAQYLTPEQNEWLEDWWLDRLDSYAQEKIDQIFKEGNERIDKDLVDRRPIRLVDKETI